MACPCFLPQGPLRSWMNPPRVPLVEPCDGVCSRTGTRPEERILRQCCNLGYARGRCPSVAAGDPDALRLSAAGRGAGRPRVRYALEKDHVPVECGWAEDAPPGSPLEAQARAFLAAWLGRAGHSGAAGDYA